MNVPTDLDQTDSLCEKLDRREFVDLLQQMLAMDQDKRIGPDAALMHPFVQMTHLAEYSTTN